jgi:hypothetical protein
VIYGSDRLTWIDALTVTPEGHLLVNGTVTITGTQAVEALLARITIFDAEQDVIAAAFTEIADGRLEPGESGDFSFRITEFGGEPADYIVDVQGLSAE